MQKAFPSIGEIPPLKWLPKPHMSVSRVGRRVRPHLWKLQTTKIGGFDQGRNPQSWCVFVFCSCSVIQLQVSFASFSFASCVSSIVCGLFLLCVSEQHIARGWRIKEPPVNTLRDLWPIHIVLPFSVTTCRGAHVHQSERQKKTAARSGRTFRV